MTKTINYKFKCINPSDYELFLEMKADKKTLNLIFVKSLEKLKKKGIAANKDDLNKVNIIEIPLQYHNLIKINCNPVYRHISDELSKDKIIILNRTVTKCIFKKINDVWNIHITMQGQYADKR